MNDALPVNSLKCIQRHSFCGSIILSFSFSFAWYAQLHSPIHPSNVPAKSILPIGMCPSRWFRQRQFKYPAKWLLTHTAQCSVVQWIDIQKTTFIDCLKGSPAGAFVFSLNGILVIVGWQVAGYYNTLFGWLRYNCKFLWSEILWKWLSTRRHTLIFSGPCAFCASHSKSLLKMCSMKIIGHGHWRDFWRVFGPQSHSVFASPQSMIITIHQCASPRPHWHSPPHRFDNFHIHLGPGPIFGLVLCSEHLMMKFASIPKSYERRMSICNSRFASNTICWRISIHCVNSSTSSMASIARTRIQLTNTTQFVADTRTPRN